MGRTSSIAIGEADSFELDGPLEIRECVNDTEYPLALEGTSRGGHDVSISLTPHDVIRLLAFFQSY